MCNAKVSAQVLRAYAFRPSYQAPLAGFALQAQGVGLSVTQRLRHLAMTDRQTVLHSALAAACSNLSQRNRSMISAVHRS